MIATIETVRKILADAQKSLDTRIHFCQVELDSLEDNQAVLSGEVLDESTRQALLLELEQRLPALNFNTRGLDTLRSSNPQCLTVATNLTSLHDAPSWLAQQLTQLLGGNRLEMLREQGRWVFVRQEDGYLGWAYRPYLSLEAAPTPTHWVCVPRVALHSEPDPGSTIESILLCGAGAAPLETRAGWARLEQPGGHTGWVQATHLRAFTALPVGEAERRSQMVADGLSLTGINYLWGGSSTHGIDCSGFAQLVHRLIGITLPRDADQQFSAGTPIAEPFQPGDLLFFGEKGEDSRRITHVGMSLGGWRILHSSRSRNGVYIDDVQSVPHLKETYVGARTFL